MDDTSTIEYTLSASEAAAILRINVRTLQKLRDRKNGPPYVRIVGRVKYSRKSLEAWLKSRVES